MLVVARAFALDVSVTVVLFAVAAVLVAKGVLVVAQVVDLVAFGSV